LRKKEKEGKRFGSAPRQQRGDVSARGGGEASFANVREGRKGFFLLRRERREKKKRKGRPLGVSIEEGVRFFPARKE